MSKLDKVKQFLRAQTDMFTISELLTYLRLELTVENVDKISQVLVGEALAYYVPTEASFENDLWVARHTFFSKRIFSTTISDYELKNNIYIPGSRFLPFTNLGNTNKDITILYNGKEIKKKQAFMPFDKILSYYFLDSENTVSHLLCDESQSNVDIFSENEEGFNLESNFSLTVWDFSEIYDKYKIFANSEPLIFLIRIIDWELGIFELIDKLCEIPSKEKQEHWFDIFDYGVRNSLKILPVNATTYEILSFTFFLCDTDIFITDPVPMELFFEKRDSFEVKPYGIEEKFWLKEEELPVPSNWFDYPANSDSVFDDFFADLNLPVTENIITNFIINSIEQNYAARFDEEIKKTVLSELTDFFLPENSSDEKSECYDLLESKYEFFSREYNPFTDSELKNFREATIVFYKELFRQFTEIKKYKLETKDVDRQTSLIFYQVMFKMLQAFDFLSNMNSSEYHFLSMLLVTVENLSFVFSKTKVEIINAITKKRTNM